MFWSISRKKFMPQCFSKIEKWMDQDSLLLINLPNPNYILYHRNNSPEILQEIDNPVFLNRLSQVLDINFLEINYFETYSVWVKNDYQFIVVKKKNNFVKLELRLEQSIFEKLVVRLKRDLRRIIYNYPKSTAVSK